MSERVHLLPGVFIGSHAVAAGALTQRQLRALGYRRLVQGVYADPSLPLDHRLVCRGVALLLPPGTAIAGRSAAAWYGAPFAGPHDPVTVLRPPTVEWRGPRGVRVHRSQSAFGVVVDPDDVPITTAMRTAWDTAVLEPLGTAVATLDAMARAEKLHVPDLRDAVRSARGQWGVTRVRRAAELVDARADSPPESLVRVALRMAGLTPEPQYMVFSGGEFLGRVDLAFPEARLAIEYEGAHHFEDDQIAKDDARYARLREAGWTVIRLSTFDLRQLDLVVARVREALRVRR